MNSRVNTNKNPLANYMRQPKIYITLPSRGEYWPQNSIKIPENGEFPVYSMTAKDELLFKTPDALLNGQAVVDVIQSCMPNIKNAWDTPSIDLDTILIAIRLATYGEVLQLKNKVPIINEEVEYELDLRILLDQQQNNTWIEEIDIDSNLFIYVKPLTYKHMTKVSLQTFEANKIMSAINDDKLTDDKKLEIFNSSFSNLTQVTVNLIGESIYKIVTPEVEVSDSKNIMDFINNVDKDVFDRINKHLNKLKVHNELKPLTLMTTEEQQAQGAPTSYQIPINFNDSDFFEQGF